MKKRILIVEDEAMTALTERDILTDFGYEVVEFVFSGESALEKVSEIKPDLVLMDIQLAGHMDGTEAAQKIRELHRIPVLFVTALGIKEETKSLQTPPPEDLGFIVKPFTEEELKREIERLIG